MLSEAIACLVWFVYCSFFEWFVHRHLMHEKRFPLHEAFHGHTVIHHQLYKWDRSFERYAAGRAPHVFLRWSAFPAMLGFHLPIFWAIEHFTGWHSFWGATAGCTIYFSLYEYVHYMIHTPRGHFIERTRWFKFLKEHHRLHHKYYLRNINVFIPLGDLVFGTLVTSEGWRSKPQKRQRTIEKRQDIEQKVPAKSEA